MQDVINDYKNRATLAAAEAEKYRKLSNTYSLYRLIIFGLMILAVIIAVRLDTFSIIAIAAIILVFCFTWLVSRQSEFDKQKAYYQNLVRVNENEIQSVTDHKNIYPNGQQFTDEKHFYTSDLDIFGEASLFQLANRGATARGNQKLAAWLSAPADKPEILSRQKAVKELAGKINWKHDMQARLLFAMDEKLGRLDALFSYLQTPLELKGRKWIDPYIKLAPWLLLALIIGGYFYHPANTIAIVLGIFNIGLVSTRGSFIGKSSSIADKMGDVLAGYAEAFKRIELEQWEQGRCRNLAQKLIEDGASKKIAELAVLINKLGYCLNMIVGFILNLFFLWALKQTIAIEDWKRDNQHNLEEAFDIIAEFETMLSLVGLHINYPDWCFPQIAGGEGYTLIVKELAHPLIYKGTRVANDYSLDNAFRIDIITGSNMAGKSTFLRTVGINTVLALSGAPVCADRMEVSVMEIISYMRIKDSLSESTSTFKAEIDRLKMLLTEVAGDKKVFFLVDEMLRGTNSVDKYRGSKAVIIRLMTSKGVGMVATHDLQIAELEEDYPDYIRNFYFDIQVKDGEMLFDYKIKHGECKTFNASLLLKQIGIDVDSNSN